jgi:hypothetical protein
MLCRIGGCSCLLAVVRSLPAAGVCATCQVRLLASCLIGAVRVDLVCPACCATRATHCLRMFAVWLLCSSPAVGAGTDRHSQAQPPWNGGGVNILFYCRSCLFSCTTDSAHTAPASYLQPLHAGVGAVKPDRACSICSIRLTGSAHHDGRHRQLVVQLKVYLLLLTCIFRCCMQVLSSAVSARGCNIEQ